jgi:hypothetical protein
MCECVDRPRRHLDAAPYTDTVIDKLVPQGLSFVVLCRPVVLKGEDVGGVRSTSTLLYVEEEHHARMHHVVRQFWPVCIIVPGVTPTSHAHTPSMLRVHTSKLLLILGVFVHVTSFNC